MEKPQHLLSSEVETLEQTKLKLTMAISPERFREGLQHAYNKSKQYFNIPGFRKGKATRRVIEQAYGADVFYDDAINFVLPDAYEEALDTHNIEPVYKPEIDLGDISEKTGAVIIATVFVRPPVEIDEYAGLTYPKGETEATEEEIENALKAEQEKNARLMSVERPAEMGDLVTMNFKGYVDGEPFEGGAGEEHELKLGSQQFIPGFEEQLVGVIPGDDKSVEVTFPEDYHHEDLKGKAATFEVEILDIKANELPEINDEFAEDVSEFDTLEEFRADLASKITENKTKTLENRRKSHVMKKLAALCKTEIPEEMYLGRLDDMYNEFCRSIRARGMDVDAYMRFTQTSEEFLRVSWRKQAEIDIANMLALEAVATKENITVSDEDFRKKVAEIVEKEGEELDKFIEDMHPSRKVDVERTIKNEKALELVMEKAVEDPDEEFDEETLEETEDIDETEEVL